MRKPTRRTAVLATGAAGAAVALGIGGFAYAAGSDPTTPDQGYVVIEDGPNGSNGQDCPDKSGGEGQGGRQPEQAPSERPSQRPSQTDVQGQV